MPVRIGVIGCGAIAQRRHIPETLGHPKARLAAVADVKLDRARAFATPSGAVAYRDYRDLVADPNVDAVVVCTPNVFHARHAIDALRAGKHVLVEKPMAASRQEARAMIAAAAKARRILMVGQNQRLMPPHVKAKEILDSGKLGRVLSFRTNFQHGGPERWSVDGKESWFFRPKLAVMGVCGDLGVHKVDLMRYLLNDEFVQVAGFLATRDKTDPAGRALKLDDNAYFSLLTRTGVVGSMTISWTNYGRMEDNSTTIFCERGVLLIGTDRKFGVIVNHSDGKVEQIVTGAIATNKRQVPSGMMEMFLDAIVRRKKPLIDGNEGYRSLDVILSAMEAARSGRTVRIRH
jgi:predicted dehydrogenase